MEHGFGSSWNPEMFRVKTQSTKNRFYPHFICRDYKKTGSDKFYLYKGLDFKDSRGYQLIMMAKHFPDKNEIRIYSTNDIAGDSGLISHHNKFKKANS